MFDLLGGEPASVSLTMYTDSFVIKGQLRSRQNRISDILNRAEEDFLVLRMRSSTSTARGSSRRAASSPR